MTEETAIRIAETFERVARAVDFIAVFVFLSICLAIVIWVVNRT